MIGDPKVVYLDQNKWSDIAKCKLGKKGFEYLIPTVNFLYNAVKRGEIVLACSIYNLIESSSITKKLDLKDTIIDVICDFDAKNLIEYICVLKNEIILAVKGDANPKHYLNSSDFFEFSDSEFDITFRDKDGNEFNEEIKRDFIKHAQSQRRTILKKMLEDPLLNKNEQEQLLNEMAKAKGILSELLNPSFENKIKALSVMNFKSYMKFAIDNNFFDIDVVTALVSKLVNNIDSVYIFVKNLPAFRTCMILRASLYQDMKSEIDKNDFIDTSFLSVAIPYCDIIVAEKTWTNRVKNLKLCERYGSVITSDLSEIVSILECNK